MSEKTYIKIVWVIARSEGMAWQLLKKPDHVYTDHSKALRDFERVKSNSVFDGWSKGQPWHLFTLTFAVTFAKEGEEQ